MQSSKVLKVVEWSKSIFFWFFGKVKDLLLYILKHPLGSIFWVIKAYLALMFLTLFVACSFGAFAVPIVEIKTKPAQQQPMVTCSAYYNGTKLGEFSGKTFGECVTSGAPSINAAIQLPPASSSVIDGGLTLTVSRTFTPINEVSEASASIGFRIIETTVQSRCAGNSNGDQICSSEPPTQYAYGVGGQINIGEKKVGYVCPPEGFPEYSVGPDKNNLCSIAQPRPQRCWPEQGSWQMAPMYHMSDSGAANLCAINDEGINCPWKQVSKGVYVPDPTSPLDCDHQDPDPPPPPVDGCRLHSSGLKVCPDDPNNRCSTTSEPGKVPVISCDPDCGYVNENFACFAHPYDPKKDPNMPDKDPLKDVDDNITDPNKPLGDMLKRDFKDIFKGAETRLDNLLISAKNKEKGQEAQMGNLTSAQREGNRQLKSIADSTKKTEDNTKGILDALTGKGEGEGKGGVKPEFKEPTNDWDKRNFGSILKSKGDELFSLPLFKSIDSFFNVSFGGTCPQYSVNVWVFDLSVDQFCSATMNSMWPYIRAIVLLVCSFFAIRIALL